MSTAARSRRALSAPDRECVDRYIRHVLRRRWTGAHIGLVAHGVRAGDENGGLTFVNYNAAPDTIPSSAERGHQIPHPRLPDGAQARETTAATRCVVRLWKTPNQVEITGCQWAAGPDQSTGRPPCQTNAGRAALEFTSAPMVRILRWSTGSRGIADEANPARTRHWMPAAIRGARRTCSVESGGEPARSLIPSDRVTVDLGLPAPAHHAIRAKDISVTPLS